MEWCMVTPLISLSDILALQDQPVCEEQAWALCYQLCLLLDKNLHPDFSHRSWGGFKVPGPEEIFLSPDGSLSLRMSIGKTVDEQFLMKTEDQTVDYVGRLMYSCLDWGLGADVERELDETLELMVGQMTKVDPRLGSETVLQPICTISDVLQVCEERLYNPSQAAQHYRSVCATLYSHTVELCHYLQVIQNTRESLQNMIMESETPQSQNAGTNEKFVWKHLVEELKRGVVLQPPTNNVNTDALVPVETSPFDQLLQDIRLKRYTLRKVEVNGSAERNDDPHQALLMVIRSRPKLRPVSERVSSGQNKKCEASLHELLMQEIRMMDRTKLRPCRTGPSSRDSLHEETSFFLNSLSNTDPVGTPCGDGTSPDGSSSHNGSMTGLINVQKETLRIPSQILSSTPMSFSRECTASRKKLRARSFGSSQELCPPVLESQISVPMTITDVIKAHHYNEEKTTSAVSCRNWRVCSCCTKRSLYFTWHNCCSLCSRTVCPDCCFELRLPFKWCVNLPMSFFKKITLNENCEQSKKEFWSERWSWDSSRVPLVLTALVPVSCSSHTLVMRDWHSQEVCASCRELLSEAFDSEKPQNQIKCSREI